MPIVQPFFGTTSQVVTDTLTGTDPPVPIATYSAAWTQAVGAINVGASGCTPNSSSISIAVNSAALPNDQYAQCTLGTYTGSTVQIGVVVRGTTGGSGYVMWMTHTNVYVNVMTNGALTSQKLNIALSPVAVAGDVFRLTVTGPMLNVERNGVLLWKGQDFTFSSGFAGVAGQNIGPNVYINGWSAGSASYQPPTPGYITSPFSMSLSGLTANTWKTITVSGDGTGSNGPPGYATGLMLLWSSPNATTVITRTNSNDTVITQPPVGNAAGAAQQGYLHTGVVWNTGNTQCTFDIIVSNATSFVLYLIGYYGPEAFFFNPSIAVTTPGTFPGTITLPSQVPSSAVGIIANLWGDTCRIVPHGDANLTNYTPVGLNAESVLSGVSGGQIDITAAAASTPVLYLRGYFKFGFVWNAAPRVVSPTTGGFVAVPQPGPYTGVANGFVYLTTGTVNFGLTVQWTVGGNFLPNLQRAPQSQGCQMIGPGQYPVVNIAAAGLTMAEQAYFVSALPVAAPTTSKAYLAIRTTSQTG